VSVPQAVINGAVPDKRISIDRHRKFFDKKRKKNSLRKKAAQWGRSFVLSIKRKGYEIQRISKVETV